MSKNGGSINTKMYALLLSSTHLLHDERHVVFLTRPGIELRSDTITVQRHYATKLSAPIQRNETEVYKKKIIKIQSFYGLTQYI